MYFKCDKCGVLFRAYPDEPIKCFECGKIFCPSCREEHERKEIVYCDNPQCQGHLFIAHSVSVCPDQFKEEKIK